MRQNNINKGIRSGLAGVVGAGVIFAGSAGCGTGAETIGPNSELVPVRQVIEREGPYRWDGSIIRDETTYGRVDQDDGGDDDSQPEPQPQRLPLLDSLEKYICEGNLPRAVDDLSTRDTDESRFTLVYHVYPSANGFVARQIPINPEFPFTPEKYGIPTQTDGLVVAMAGTKSGIPEKMESGREGGYFLRNCGGLVLNINVDGTGRVEGPQVFSVEIYDAGNKTQIPNHETVFRATPAYNPSLEQEI